MSNVDGRRPSARMSGNGTQLRRGIVRGVEGPRRLDQRRGSSCVTKVAKRRHFDNTSTVTVVMVPAVRAEPEFSPQAPVQQLPDGSARRDDHHGRQHLSDLMERHGTVTVVRLPAIRAEHQSSARAPPLSPAGVEKWPKQVGTGTDRSVVRESPCRTVTPPWDSKRDTRPGQRRAPLIISPSISLLLQHRCPDFVGSRRAAAELGGGNSDPRSLQGLASTWVRRR
jgi:hypothetical protein